MIVVSDTSPIMNLAAVGRLELLERVFGRVVVPSAVRQELSAMGSAASGLASIEGLSWVEARDVENRTLVDALLLELDPGEAEAIALAVELRAGLLLMDERRGRRAASALGLKWDCWACSSMRSGKGLFPR